MWLSIRARTLIKVAGLPLSQLNFHIRRKLKTMAKGWSTALALSIAILGLCPLVTLQPASGQDPAILITQNATLGKYLVQVQAGTPGQDIVVSVSMALAETWFPTQASSGWANTCKALFWTARDRGNSSNAVRLSGFFYHTPFRPTTDKWELCRYRELYRHSPRWLPAYYDRISNGYARRLRARRSFQPRRSVK